MEGFNIISETHSIFYKLSSARIIDDNTISITLESDELSIDNFKLYSKALVAMHRKNELVGSQFKTCYDENNRTLQLFVLKDYSKIWEDTFYNFHNDIFRVGG